MKFVEYEVPELKDNECLIRVKAVGICGSDLHMYDGHGGYDWVTYPLVLGHEVVGEVIAVGNHNATEYLSKRVATTLIKAVDNVTFVFAGKRIDVILTNLEQSKHRLKLYVMDLEKLVEWHN